MLLNPTIGMTVEATGSRRDRGTIVEIDEAAQRARINWTHRQRYSLEFINGRDRTNWSGEFKPFETQQPRTWIALKTLIEVKGA